MDSSNSSVKVWYDGEILPAEEAMMPVSWVGPRLSTAVFDGIRAYWNEARQQLSIFRLQEHMDRFAQARRFQRMECTWSDAELTQAAIEVLRVNDFRADAYIAPTAFFGIDATRSGGGNMGQETHIAMAPRLWPSSLDAAQAIDCGISSWVRIADNSMPPRIKCIANYHNYRLATLDVQSRGKEHFFSAIMLNQRGKVSEGAMASLFMVRQGRAITAPLSADILESITRDTVMELCRRELEVEVVERDIDRSELYVADEVFLCGTGSEIIPVATIDEALVGKGAIGPLTGRLLGLYESIVRGGDERYAAWRTPV